MTTFTNDFSKENMLKTDLAIENWRLKYQYTTETPLGTFIRAAKTAASVENDPDFWEKKFLESLVKFDETGIPLGIKATPGGRITANIGTDYKNATMFNCFSGETLFLTKEGYRKFKDCIDKEVEVLTKEGWVKSSIKSFGIQTLNKITFKPCVKQVFIKNRKTGRLQNIKSLDSVLEETYKILGKTSRNEIFYVTPNHRWQLVDGNMVESLKIGDVVESNVNTFFDVNSKDYIQGVIHGIIFGDGYLSYTRKDETNVFYVRLCGKKSILTKFFDGITYPKSNKGDPLCKYISTENLKGIPENEKSIDYKVGFISGLIYTDGHKYSENRYQISTQNLYLAQWLDENLIFAGFYSFGVKTVKNNITNYGARKSSLNTINFRSENVKWKVTENLESVKQEEVYCAIVPNIERFTLFNGVYTSNCFITGPVKGAKITYERRIKDLTTIKVEYDTPDTGDDLKNIFLTLMEQAKTLAAEGGYGLNVSFIRPRGSVIKGTGVEHPGVIRYLEIWDKVSDIIVSGNNDGYESKMKDFISEFEKDPKNTLYSNYKNSFSKKAMSRRGAMLCCLDINHPDIEEFILAKQKPKYLTKFNMSVIVTDAFMEAVDNNEFWKLEFEGKLYKVVKAKELYNLIMTSCFSRAEPGILYYDNMQKNNPFAYAGLLNATNPCGEIGGNPEISTVCLLISINLTQYVKKNRTFDFETYTQDIRILSRFIDNINDLEKNNLPHYLWAIKNVRQYGMGLNGFGSMLYMMGIPYNDTKACELADKLNRIKMNECLRESALLAKEKGPAPAFNKDYYNTYYWKEFTKNKIDPDVRELVETYGVRNLKQTTNPPLGNSSVLCDNISNGIEPVFTYEYERTYITNKFPEGMNQDNVKSILKEIKIADSIAWKGHYEGKIYYYEPHNRGLCIVEKVVDFGYNWVRENYPEDLKNNSPYLVIASQLDVKDHTKMQVHFQKYLDQSVSKTANIPNNYNFEDFKVLYMDAWKNGLNGFTTYREGTMENVLSKIEEQKNTLERKPLKEVLLPKKFTNGPCEIIKREGIKFYIHFSYLPEDSEMLFPIAIWINTNHPPKGEALYVRKALKSLEKLLESFEIPQKTVDFQLEKITEDSANVKLGKMISMCLRHNLPISSIIMSLENLEGDNISTLLSAIRKFLSKHIKDGTQIINKTCSNCESKNLVFESGCSKCLDCGSSNCG